MEATTKQEEDRQFFMEQLRTDREKFADELDEWDAEIRALNALGGGDNPIGDVETNAATVWRLLLCQILSMLLKQTDDR